MTVDTREIPYRINVAETGAAEKSLDRESLPCPDFHYHRAVGIQMRAALGWRCVDRNASPSALSVSGATRGS